MSIDDIFDLLRLGFYSIAVLAVFFTLPSLIEAFYRSRSEFIRAIAILLFGVGLWGIGTIIIVTAGELYGLGSDQHLFARIVNTIPAAYFCGAALYMFWTFVVKE